MATIIPAHKDIMSLKHPLQLQFKEVSQNIPIPQSNRDDVELVPRRSASARSLSDAQNTRNYYTSCIEFLQEQHKKTLKNLHLEVQKLKEENKRLNFKILVEDSGGLTDIIKTSINQQSHNSNINTNDILLLQETIKDLKVKIKILEDKLLHQNTTIKHLTKNQHRSPISSPNTKIYAGDTLSTQTQNDKLIHHLRTQNELQAKKIEELQNKLRFPTSFSTISSPYKDTANLNANLNANFNANFNANLAQNSSSNYPNSHNSSFSSNLSPTRDRHRVNHVNNKQHDTSVTDLQSHPRFSMPVLTPMNIQYSKLPPLNNTSISTKNGKIRISTPPSVANSRTDIARRIRKIEKMRDDNNKNH